MMIPDHVKDDDINNSYFVKVLHSDGKKRVLNCSMSFVRNRVIDFIDTYTGEFY